MSHTDSPMDRQTVSDSVKALYERYPFPAPVSSARPPALEGWCNYTYLYERCLHEWRLPEGRAILDAGCGTGETLWPTAVNNPGARIVGYDLSTASLRAAREKLDRLGARDVRLEERDLTQLGPPDEMFDLIFSTGVLHHLADPLMGLCNLVARLAPDGLMVLMFYAASPRQEIKKVQDVLDLLCGPADLPQKVATARRLFACLPHGHILRNPNRLGEDLTPYLERDEHLIDTFFHPREVWYSMDSLFDLLDAAGLELVRFTNEPAFDVTKLLPDADLQRRAMFMSRRQKYKLADLIDPQGDYQFMARHKGFRPRRPLTEDEMAGAIPHPSPVLTRIERVPLASAPLLPRQAMLEVNGFAAQRFRLDEETARVLDACDGRRTVADIAGESADAGATRDLIRALAAHEVICFERPA